MTLLITVFAAIISSALWYKNLPGDNKKIGMLSLMYWGASLMWFVDAFVEYREVGAEFFNPPVAQMLNEAYLGFSVVALGLIAWLVVLLIKDPRKVLYKKR
ncbi:MAG: hypothetical protein LBM93_03190 [Oscillospiraceae bacterium]|jgi:hypothetical protein|nr:hypothetical protein [Oscillospiraceae bacterium]